jgi:hypothetical protein
VDVGLTNRHEGYCNEKPCSDVFVVVVVLRKLLLCMCNTRRLRVISQNSAAAVTKRRGQHPPIKADFAPLFSCTSLTHFWAHIHPTVVQASWKRERLGCADTAYGNRSGAARVIGSDSHYEFVTVCHCKIYHEQWEVGGLHLVC